MKTKNSFIDLLKKKSNFVRKETLRIHRHAPETRLASSLSAVEIFTVLYYGKILRFRPKNVNWKKRDRFIVSKGHGAISLYPILAYFGFFPKERLRMVCKEGCILGGIPDPVIPGFETVNGSLGHGLGVACGIAIALKRKKSKAIVFVLVGDGELNEGSVWEAIMFAGMHKIDNLVLIVDNNKACMLDYCKNVIDLSPLDKKFEVFNWDVKMVDGHNVECLYNVLQRSKKTTNGMPKVVIANTIKGKGVFRFETDPLSHIKNLKPDEAEALITDLE